MVNYSRSAGGADTTTLNAEGLVGEDVIREETEGLEEDRSRDGNMTTEVGEMVPTLFNKRAIVISDGWPSIHFALLANGFDSNCLMCTSDTPDAVVVDADWETLMGSRVSLCGSTSGFSVPEADSYWVQGTKDFVALWSEKLNGKLFIGVCPGQGRKWAKSSG